jgi:hypothetical protein
MVYATDKQIEAVAYELAERFFKRIGGGNSLHDVDVLAAVLATVINDWLKGKGRVAPSQKVRPPAERQNVPPAKREDPSASEPVKAERSEPRRGRLDGRARRVSSRWRRRSPWSENRGPGFLFGENSGPAPQARSTADPRDVPGTLPSGPPGTV